MLVPYVDLHPLAREGLLRHFPDAELVRLSRAPDAYYSFLSAEWASGVGFVVVEQDIEIHADVVPQLEACSEPYCVFPYSGPIGDGQGDPLLYNSLGCTRFSSALLAELPSLMAELPVRDWRRLDAHIWPALQGAGVTPHFHWPVVKHHHVFEGRCACGEEH